MSDLWVGCSGWNYDDWRGTFYPAGEAKRRWLCRYAEHFNTVEVNATFYRLASERAVRSWVQDTPPDFQFAVKASRFLTHVKRLRDIEEGIRRFYAPLQPLIEAGRLGPVLWQLPENFHRDDQRLLAWLELLPPGRHVIEFRHANWFAEPVLEQLRRHAVALAVGEHPKRDFQSLTPTADWRYIRFHYGNGRDGNYSEAQLRGWAQRIAGWLADGPVYVYFNNDWQAFAPANATRLRHLLERRLEAAGGSRSVVTGA